MDKSVMDAFIHQENVALFKTRLAEAKDEATRTILTKLLAEEEEKNRPPKAE